MPGIRAGISRFAGDMFGAIAHASPKGRSISRVTSGLVEASHAYGDPDAALRAFAAGRKDLIARGKRTAGFGIMGASGISMAASNRSTGAYNPAPRPMTSAPPGIGRSA